MNRKRLSILLLSAAALLVVWGIVWWSGRETGDGKMRRTAEAFLQAGDAGKFDDCAKMGALDELEMKVYEANRSSLGGVKQRFWTEPTPLRRDRRAGFLFVVRTHFEQATIREEIAVMAEPDKPAEVEFVRYRYNRLPRPTNSPVRYSGPDRAQMREEAVRCAEAFDKQEWRYFEAIAVRDTGYARRNAGAPLVNFQKKYGVAENRSFLTDVRYEEKLPGCVNLALAAVTNRVTYRTKSGPQTVDERIYLVRNRLSKQPKWEPYAFDPGRVRPAAKPTKKPAPKR